MEVITIEKQTFEEMTAKFDEFVKRVERICHRNSAKGMGEWLDNQEMCRILNICPRTLQDYRNEGRLPYIQLGGKILYRESDVEKTLEEGYQEAFRLKDKGAF